VTIRRSTLAVAIVAAFLVPPAAAQVVVDNYKDSAGQIRSGTGVAIIAPFRGTSTPVAGTVTTANTFQSALAAASARKGCAIYNTSSIPIPAGGSFNCGSFQGLVLTDQISITSATAAATFVVVSQ
jgi:hypothetical protein